MCMCACVRSAAFAALAPVMPRTERDSGVRSDSGVCRIACSPLVRCGCDAGEPVSVCMCACVYGADRPCAEVVGSITHHLCVSVNNDKSQCFQRFPGIFLTQLPGTLCQKSYFFVSKGEE